MRAREVPKEKDLAAHCPEEHSKFSLQVFVLLLQYQYCLLPAC